MAHSQLREASGHRAQSGRVDRLEHQELPTPDADSTKIHSAQSSGNAPSQISYPSTNTAARCVPGRKT